MAARPDKIAAWLVTPQAFAASTWVGRDVSVKDAKDEIGRLDDEGGRLDALVEAVGCGALSKLRHLYQQMVDGRITDSAEGARKLRQAIEVLLAALGAAQAKPVADV